MTAPVLDSEQVKKVVFCKTGPVLKGLIIFPLPNWDLLIIIFFPV
jgi:hypothetical protein